MLTIRKFLLSPTTFKVVSRLLFICFIILLVFIIIFKTGDELVIFDSFEGLSIISFKERLAIAFTPLFLAEDTLPEFIDFILNVLVFVPFGIFLPILTNKTAFFKFLLISFLISLTFEIYQLFTLLGFFALGDLCANTLGFVVGYVFYFIALKNMKNITRTTLFTLALLIALPFCVYAIIRTVSFFDFYYGYLQKVPSLYFK